MFKSAPGVQRPLLYVVAAVIAAALAVPLAVSSGQIKSGGIFDECYEEPCDGAALLARAD
ncbi:MAG: hypothetical protein AAFX54_15190 [Pseudomonadota bacterium]